LAPFYDLLSTAPYDNVSNVFAMRINGRRTFDELQSGDWAALAEATGLSGSAIPRRVTQVLRRIDIAVDARIAAGDDTALIALVRARTQHLLSMLGKA
jgi:hypothetical protein